MSMLMMTVQLDPREASLANVRRKLQLARNEIDPNFGVVSLKPEENLYAILVDEAASARLAGTEGVVGPFANPRIETFGTPER